MLGGQSHAIAIRNETMKTTIQSSRRAIVALVAIALASSLHAQLAVSTFDSDRDGWTAVDRDATTAVFLHNHSIPTYQSSGGNPGGFIQVSDEGPEWYFRAPSKFLGDKSAAYGGTLSYDLAESYVTRGDDTVWDVIISDGTTTLYYDVGALPPPGMIWTNYVVPIVEAGWTNFVTGLPATRQEMLAVLASLTVLDIHGEIGAFADTGSLDNVVMTSDCPAASIRLSEAEICWPSQSNRLYRVDYRSTFETTNTWVVLFTNIVGTGDPICVYDKIPRARPQRFYRVACPTE
jgi:hypothetical protein